MEGEKCKQVVGILVSTPSKKYCQLLFSSPEHTIGENKIKDVKNSINSQPTVSNPHPQEGYVIQINTPRVIGGSINKTKKSN